MNFGHNGAKQLFARHTRAGGVGPEAHKIIKTLCAVKAMVSWHCEKTARICRERTGGAGFLQTNVIGLALFGAHAGSTAEGDNKVLMQKIVKDILADT